MQKNVRRLTYTALMTAFVFITTSIIKIPIPFTNGYIHAGDMSIFVGAILLGPFYGAIAGGLGSALADFLGGYAQWVIPTLLVKGIMGFIVGYFMTLKANPKSLYAILTSLWLGGLVLISHYVSSLDATTVVSSVEEVSGLGEVSAFIHGYNQQLLVIGILLPIIMALMAFFGHRIGLKFIEVFGMVLAGIWMCFGYYVAGSLMYGSFISSLFSIPWNVAQFIGGAVLAFIVLNALKPTGIKDHIKSTMF